MENITFMPLISGIFIGLAAGYLGSFMILRRMALVGDALSHVALPGIAIGLLMGFNPIFGAFISLLGGIIVVWLLENKTKLPTEALIGLLFTVGLSIGILITPNKDLLEALFGKISDITFLGGIITILLSVAVIIFMKRISKGFMIATISEELAQSVNIKPIKLNFIFLILIAIIVALGIKTVGTLLMGALVIIPAIASRNIARGLSSYVKLAATIGALSGAFGILIAVNYSLPPGPVVVLVSALFFILTLFFKKN